MRLRSIYIEGFRGALNPIHFDFGSNFTVITGRNGSGKSTVCDALEYLITGTLERFQLETEKGERIENYLWWRGGGSPASRIVRVTFVDEEGKQFTVSRGPDSVDNHEQLSELYDSNKAPDFVLPRLCQTSIIRDESITRFSTDMGETERFDFVNRAIGVSGFAQFEERLSLLGKRLKQVSSARNGEYERARAEVGRLTSDLSQARIAASASAGVDLQDAIASLSSNLGGETTDTNVLVKASRDLISRLRNEVDEIERTAADLRELEADQSDQLTAKRALDLQRSKIQQTEISLKEQEAGLSKLSQRLEKERAQSPKEEGLANLVAQGSRLGLEEGRCPLCGSNISQREFEAHLAEVQAKLRMFSSVLTDLVNERNNAKASYDQTLEKYEQLKKTYEEKVAEMEAADARLTVLRARAAELGVDSPSALTAATQLRRERVHSLEKNLSILQSSLAVDRVTELERQLSIAQEKVSIADADLSKAIQAEDLTREIDATLRRVNAEIVDERLADLSPLSSELYLRLRPHTEWAEIQYLMRGDIRRFLSFSVGPDINPRFVFSSGQRRALGLSFLLAVHLSRTWCKLQTLLLDDPVQHIDDYRAMHLVEVLSAISKTEHQIICAVEDPELAGLLCRRLRAGSPGTGVKVEMKFDPGIGISATPEEIVPLASTALLSA